MYKVTTKIEQISKNTALLADSFGGWQVICIGDDPVSVNGVKLSASGNVIGLDYTNLHPSVMWDEPINILFDGVGINPKIIVTRLKYIQL